ncbi:MAG: hypothetical protein Q4E65_07430 [Clostridia bacterium]|nr:hypothetical protein [Clostridia bacterium]
MDATDERIRRAKKKALRGLIWLLCILAVLLVCAFLLHRYSSFTFLMPEPKSVSYAFRCDNRDIEYKNGEEWEPFIVRGVELANSQNGASYDTYARWLASIAAMNANAVRVHAVMPPDFYRALYELNQSGVTLWLLQGVELSDEVFAQMTDMRSGDMVGLLSKEGRLAIDAVHGNKREHGYAYDVSGYTMAYIIGDKWDPDLVLYTDQAASEIAGRFDGRYASVWDTGDPTVTLLAEVFDDLFSYETRKYAQQHIMGLGNTQKTDLLFHDTTWAVGLNENIVDVNTTHISPTARVQTGIFAALRVEPGVMQNLSFDPDYIEFTDAYGVHNPIRYYLDALYNGHRVPVMLGGVTMSASRGCAGLDALLGYDRGGVGETVQADGLSFVYTQAVNAGFCGGCAGYYLDDPHRTAWNMKLFTDHNGRWLDAQDAEQGLGIFALEPDSPYLIDGDPSEWKDVPPLVAKDGLMLQAAGDEKYLYLHVHIPNYDAQNDVFYIPFDVTPLSGAAEDRGQNLTYDRDMDFLLSVNGAKRAKLVVQSYYEPVEALYEQELEYEFWFVDPPDPHDDDFVSTQQYVRPALFPDGGGSVNAVLNDTGLLRCGNANPAAPDYDSRADYCVEGEDVELRIPWALLNFTDPSAGRIMGDIYTQGNHSITIDAIYMGFALYKNRAMQQFPSAALALPCYDTPAYRERTRAAYFALRDLFKENLQ